jgi:hypothetical protein
VNADDKALRAALRAEFRRLHAARDALKRGNRVVHIEAAHFMRHRGPGNYEAAVRQQNERRQIKAILAATTASRWPA